MTIEPDAPSSVLTRPVLVPAPPDLDGVSSAMILTLARAAMTAALADVPMPMPPELAPALERPAAVFVTITRGGELRGCIGHLDPDVSLAANLLHAARAAATSDPRFDPIRSTELADLELEVSVLGPLVPLSDPSDFDPLTMGIVVGRGGRRGLLLPQVARERGWSARETLEAACWKAGLPVDAWRDRSTTLEVFGATIIEETERR